MCGIVGAVSNRNISDFLVEGLKKLEYRGYDSAGVLVINAHHKFSRLRRLGKVNNLNNALIDTPIQGNTGIAHTRWATHGEPAEKNAHPHLSEHIAVVHNGIIENHEQLRAHLIECGYHFNSETDTEVIAHLINWEQKTHQNTFEAVQACIKQLRGSYAMVVAEEHKPKSLIAARSGSPIVIGLGKNENFVASDQLPLQEVAEHLIFLEEGDLAIIETDKVEVFNQKGENIHRTPIDNLSRCEENISDKGKYRHFMEKEIYSQPSALTNTLRGRLTNTSFNFDELSPFCDTVLSKIEHIQIIACGTSYNAGCIARYWFESIAGISCDVEIASEFRYRHFVKRNNSLLITLSQSGETADTLAALRIAKEKHFLTTLAICNVNGSSLVRESEYAFLTRAGTEIGVASTKAFTTQLCALLMLVGKLGEKHQRLTSQQTNELIAALKTLPEHTNMALDCNQQIEAIAPTFKDKHHALFLGRGVYYPVMMEAALKIKEISYIHAESYAAGELKHGPLALIDDNMPVVVIAPDDDLIEKLKSNIEEVRARGGELVILTPKTTEIKSDNNITVVELPEVPDIIAPIVYSVPLQLLAYRVALIKGTDVDQPRHLAKSVTVE